MKKKKRLVVDMPEVIHREIARMAHKYGKTISRYVIRILMLELKREYDSERNT